MYMHVRMLLNGKQPKSRISHLLLGLIYMSGAKHPHTYVMDQINGISVKPGISQRKIDRNGLNDAGK